MRSSSVVVVFFFELCLMLGSPVAVVGVGCSSRTSAIGWIALRELAFFVPFEVEPDLDLDFDFGLGFCVVVSVSVAVGVVICATSEFTGSGSVVVSVVGSVSIGIGTGCCSTTSCLLSFESSMRTSICVVGVIGSVSVVWLSVVDGISAFCSVSAGA